VSAPGGAADAVQGRLVVEALLTTFLQAPELMPDEWNACAALDAAARARVVADYIAGMTDRYALQEHRKLSDPLVKG
jgi:dGTPase